MKKIKLLLATLLISASIFAQENNAILCSDGIDNDNDGKIDCLDDECYELPNEGCHTCLYDGSSFADIVCAFYNPCENSLNTNPQAAIGVSDFNSIDSDEFVTLGEGGHIILKFTNNILINSGNDTADVWVFEIGPAVEASLVELLPVDSATHNILTSEGIPDDDLDGFFEFDTLIGATSSLDIDAYLTNNYPAGTLKFNAIKITDIVDGECDDSPYPGADIDAVCALSTIICSIPDTELNIAICDGAEYEGYTNTGVYTDTLSGVSGCDSVRIINLTVIPLPEINIDGDFEICEGESTILTASGGTSFLWSNGEITPSITISPQASTNYSVTVTNAENCISADSITIIVHPIPSGAFTLVNDTVLISDPPFLLEGGMPTGGIYMGAGVDSLTGEFNPLDAQIGTHEIAYTLIDDFGCSNTFIDSITVIQMTNVVALPHNASIAVSPNPFSENIIIQTKNLAKAEIGITIFDLSGIPLYSIPPKSMEDKFEINLANYTSGVYLIRFEIDGAFHLTKIIKE